MPLYFKMQYCNRVIVQEFKEYEFTCKSDGINQRDVVIAEEDVSLEVEAPQCSLEMDRKLASGNNTREYDYELPSSQISKKDIDIPLLMNVDILSFQDYPPRIEIQIDNEKPRLWTICLTGLSEDVVFAVSPAIQVDNNDGTMGLHDTKTQRRRVKCNRNPRAQTPLQLFMHNLVSLPSSLSLALSPALSLLTKFLDLLPYHPS